MSNHNIQKYTIAELQQMEKLERESILKNGITVGEFHLYYQPSNLTIQIDKISKTGLRSTRREVDLELCSTSSDVLEDIYCLHNLADSTGELLAAFLTLFSVACIENFGGGNHEVFFRNPEKLNWKK
ncbi:hypothetical protein A4S05_08480 [Nostoc sp. KVJ20]|uniref:hypothetical protein n=1 Tax=Nostoc sp. KVJ20 TaxID=457944 RepID=UPI00083CBE86|nr:hypothetical protein [Nostoc sp. KVJ20]ODG98574.1 hypothetical protein A4S05_08480 [Nostoc sp. KVJ20]